MYNIAKKELDVLFGTWKKEIYKRHDRNCMPYLSKIRAKMKDRYNFIVGILNSQLTREEADIIIHALYSSNINVETHNAIFDKLVKQKEVWCEDEIQKRNFK